MLCTYPEYYFDAMLIDCVVFETLNLLLFYMDFSRCRNLVMPLIMPKLYKCVILNTAFIPFAFTP